MGKKSRRSRAAKTRQMPFTARPFAGLAAEGDLVALREIVPAATLGARLLDGEREITFVSYLPAAAAGLVTREGDLWIGLQVAHSFGDASRDLAHAIELATQTEPGELVVMTDPGIGPRLQEILDPLAEHAVTVHDSFDFWEAGLDPDIADAIISSATETIAPTEKLASVPSAYWTTMTGRHYLRWVLPGDEDRLLLALARLRAVGRDALATDTRLIGAFRAAGVLVPVWELDAGQSAQDIEDAVAAFTATLEEATASTEPVTSEVRSAKSALASRQITLR